VTQNTRNNYISIIKTRFQTRCKNTKICQTGWQKRRCVRLRRVVAILAQIFHIAVTLTLTPRPSKSNRFICTLNYITNQSLVKFWLLVCKIYREQDTRTDARTHGRATRKHNAPAAPFGGGWKHNNNTLNVYLNTYYNVHWKYVFYFLIYFNYFMALRMDRPCLVFSLPRSVSWRCHIVNDRSPYSALLSSALKESCKLSPVQAVMLFKQFTFGLPVTRQRLYWTL